ncbi:MAG: ABC transporter permease subunit [Rhodobacter sp.]|nr:ABC transporter permease subunit [Paracoccaceae bacterium]MCB1411268.1 ABC transporter permease subunit [Paracoccaceae bacterium]MCC0081441.1 ABC transporter permease subunit [Rhodobacter sp.]
MTAGVVGRARGLILPLALVVLWQALASIRGIESDTLAAPVQIVGALGDALVNAEFWIATRDTVLSAALGLALGGVLGAMTGLVFGLVPPVSRLMRVPVEVLRPVPAIALVPIAILIFGFGYALEVAIVAFAVFFPVLILIEAAVRGVEPRLTEVARLLRLSPGARIAKIVVPAVLPRAFVALRLAAGLALVVAITVEIAANPMGLGARMILAAQSLRAPDMFATLIWVAVLGWAINAGLVRAQAALFPDAQRPR